MNTVPYAKKYRDISVPRLNIGAALDSFNPPQSLVAKFLEPRFVHSEKHHFFVIGAPAMRQNDFSDNIRSKEALHLPHVEPRAMVEGIEKPQVDRYNAI